jgi:hypothetical protein
MVHPGFNILQTGRIKAYSVLHSSRDVVRTYTALDPFLCLCER